MESSPSGLWRQDGEAGWPLVANYSYRDLEEHAMPPAIPRAQLPQGSGAIQKMENPLCSLESLIDTLQTTTPSWVLVTIFTIVCVELLCLVLLPWLEKDPSLPPPRRHRHIGRCPVEARRRSWSRKKGRDLRARRVCLQELEKARELITLLRSLCSISAATWGGPLTSAAFVSSPVETPPASPSASRPPGPLLPLDGLPPPPPALSHSPPCPPDSEAHPPPPTASSVSPTPDPTWTLPQWVSVALPLGTVPHSSCPLHPRFASPSPLISAYGHASCPIRALSWWQMTTSAVCPLASSQCESQQEHPSHRPPGAWLQGDPTDRQAEASSPSLVHPGVQKLLETQPSRRAAPEMWGEKAKEGSAYPLNSLENKFPSLRAEPDTDRGPSLRPGADPTVPGALLTPELRERLERHFRQRAALQRHRHQGGPPCRVRLSVELMQPGGRLPGQCPASGQQGPWPLSGPAGSSSPAPERVGLSCPARVPGMTDQDEDMAHNVGRVLKGICSGLAGLPVKVLEMRCEKARDLQSSLTRVPDKGVGRVHSDRNLGPMNESRIPVEGCPSRLAPSPALGVPGESGNPVSLKDGDPCVSAPHATSAHSPHTQQEMPKKSPGRCGGVLKPLRPSKLTKSPRSSALWSLRTCPGTCVHRAHLKANAAKFLGDPAPPPPREKVMEESVPSLASPLPAPPPACENTQRAPGGTPPGGRQEPAKSPLTGQEGTLPSRPLTSVSVGRTWHREPAAEAGTGSRGSGPASAVTRKGSSTQSAGGTSEKSLQGVTAFEVDSEFPSSRAEEAREVMEAGKVPDWEVTSETHALATPRTIHAHLRSRSPGPGTHSSPSTVSVPRDPGEPCFDSDAQLSDREVRELVESEQPPPAPATGVLLEDRETGALLRNSATDTLLGDRNSDVFLAADLSASQRSPFGSQSISSGDMSASQELHDPVPSGGSCQQGSLSLQDQHTSQNKMCVPTDEREDNRRPRLARSTSPATGPSTARDRSSSTSSGSRSCQLGRERRAPPEGPLENNTRHFLQLVLPRNGRGQKGPQKGPPASAPARSCDSASGRSAEDRRPAEAQVLVTAVSHSVEETVTIHQGLHAPQLNWHKGEPQAPGGPHLCQQRDLRYEEQRRATQDMADGHQAIGKDHTGFNKSRCTRDRNGKWAFPPGEPGAPGRPSQYEQRVAGPSVRPCHCPRHCPFRRPGGALSVQWLTVAPPGVHPPAAPSPGQKDGLWLGSEVGLPEQRSL
ncbi:putative spermatogenesis-associated protein 31C2 [Molossus nigricans]